ncbi:G-protein coupled receptor family C group 6 member A-like [Etheostoma spectabile]|uniref:G-protein coupled receptor family C group 6 member A-like n=1 Tax=Etheostoma spectabile TaxID=54343 RepID=UPI0013AEFD2F|nr:G-protein coupled receptor family C group 6 member A-like [Etheostoma spectabile]
MHVFYPWVSTMFLLWLCVSIMSVFWHCSGFGLLNAYSPGDIIIGGLFPIHLQTNRTTIPGPLSCSNYDLGMFLGSQVMIYAIREINQRTGVLPNFTIGYDIYDTCGDVSIAMRATLQMLKNQSDPQSCLVPAAFGSTLPEPQTKAVIGERFSEVSTVVARVLALSSVPQISYSSTSELLSRKSKFPTFLRTVNSDLYQTNAIAELVKQFYWKTVAIVGSDDEYGKYGSDSVKDMILKSNDTCIEFIDILPSDFSKNDFRSKKMLAELVSKINKSSAEAIIMFTKVTNAALIMEAAVKYNLNRTWVASDAWSTSENITGIAHIKMAGEVYGFIPKKNKVPGFKDYVISMFNGSTNAILEHLLTKYPLCSNQSEGYTKLNCSLTNSEESKQCLDPSGLATCINQYESYYIYLAVQVIVEGLRSLLKCDNHQCKRSTPFTAFELLMEIKKVNFTVDTTHIFFDANGDPSVGYDIVHWDVTESSLQIETIGQYWPGGTFKVSDDLVGIMRNVTITAYNCSKTCKRGQELKKERKLCCSGCFPCAEGEYSAGDGEECKRCGLGYYSSPERNVCWEKTIDFLNWSDPFINILSLLGLIGIIISIVFAILFAIHRRTPVVNAVGGYLCFLELLSLLLCFCLTFSFVGKPTEASCKVGLPLFGIAFSLCISCILANLLQIFVGFKFDLNVSSWIKKLNQPLAVVTIVPGIQLALCVPWLCLYPPFPEHQDISREIILLQCNKGVSGFFIAMLGYNTFLALICFLFAIKGKQLPDLYKNASLVTISMLLFIIVWIFFIPIYISLVGKYKRAIESSAILISCYSILGCHLAPKCYIMVFRKEINNENAITLYIRQHYEQKDMAVVKS